MGKRTHRWTPPHVDQATYYDNPRRRSPFEVEPGSSAACRWQGCVQPFPDADLPLCNLHLRIVDEHLTAKREAQALTEAAVIEKVEAGIKLEPQDRPPGYVYYAKIDGLIKIGYAKSVRVRMGQYPPTTILMAVEPGTKKTEYARHKHFAEHLAIGREWFRDVPELRAWIATLLMEYGSVERHTHSWHEPTPRPEPVASKRIRNRRY